MRVGQLKIFIGKGKIAVDYEDKRVNNLRIFSGLIK
jgi:hypothetical protein